MMRAARFWPGLALALCLPAAAAAQERIVVAGGDLTEIVFALGAGDRVVGVDTTSVYPRETDALAKVGYMRQLSAEGVLSLAPDMAIVSADAGPPVVLSQLGEAGVDVVAAPDLVGVEAIGAKIAAVGAALGLEEEAGALAGRVAADLDAVLARVAGLPTRPRVLFVLTVQGGGPMVAGTDTAADEMIRMAGGENVVTGFEGYKPLSREALIAAAPEVVLMMESHAGTLGGVEGVLARPEFALTPAGRDGRGIEMDGMLLLGFGPRTPEAVRELARLLHGDGAVQAGL